MHVKVIPTTNFQKEVKRLLKKYNSLKVELLKLENDLHENPKIGIPLGKNIYKIRLAVKSKGKGKRGGLRIIYYLFIHLVEEHDLYNIYLLSIYDKSELQNISKKKILEIVNHIESMFT
jgi:mRNA-degrading endonuclease RelE of RelBE toxin-antitoxin system